MLAIVIMDKYEEVIDAFKVNHLYRREQKGVIWCFSLLLWPTFSLIKFLLLSPLASSVMNVHKKFK